MPRVLERGPRGVGVFLWASYPCTDTPAFFNAVGGAARSAIQQSECHARVTLVLRRSNHPTCLSTLTVSCIHTRSVPLVLCKLRAGLAVGPFRILYVAMGSNLLQGPDHSQVPRPYATVTALHCLVSYLESVRWTDGDIDYIMC